MSLRLGSLLPRVFVIVIVALLATATITFAAETRSTPTTNAPAEATAPKVLLVPDVRGQAYVFAKSTLEEAGFAWHVSGGARGYAANTVSGQSPAPGSRVYDTGSPTVSLVLRVNARYPQAGEPDSSSPFSGTPVKYVGALTKPKPKPKPKPQAKARPHRVTKPKPKHAAKPKPKHAAKPKPKPAKPKPATKPQPSATQTRPPAFVVTGAKPEPQNEIPLTTRAQNLDHWVSSHGKPSNENVSYWLYQHAWIVTGAKLGWWHGAEALQTLIRVDEKVEKQWGIGTRSERVARAALAEVRSKSK
jgi:beta-lactam-binding protein with PASTA domain